MLHPALKTARRSARSPAGRLAEAVSLAQAIDLDVVIAEIVSLDRRRPSTYVGRGTVEAFGAELAAAEVGLVCVDAALSPVQQRNLEKAWGTKVIDRTGLILEIFGDRARTREGTLQVELAHLTYQRSRLVRSWTHLERQRGALGFIGGPGETQLESDRRLIDERITRIRRELATVTRTRALHRRARKRVPYPVAALVGYTNAGKSTLFNRLTGSEVFADDQLFATLDPTMRGLVLPSGRRAILSDTVGFVSELPTMLIAAFRATLEEVLDADLILHVRDIAHPETEAQAADVRAVLGDLGIGQAREDEIIEVLNKIDLLDEVARAVQLNRAARRNDVIAVSATTGEGCESLRVLLDDALGRGRRMLDLDVDLADGATLAWLYRHGNVVSRRDDGTMAHLRVGLEPADVGRFLRRTEPGG